MFTNGHYMKFLKKVNHLFVRESINSYINNTSSNKK